jgi:hypothetical protein
LTNRLASDTVFQKPAASSARRFIGAGTTLAIRAKRKADQVIENKQSRAMTDFAPPMISRTYERVAKPLVSLGERNPFTFAVFRLVEAQA